jgi:hypothetical protein
MNLAKWFPDQDHRLYMRFERESIAEYFKPSEEHVKNLAERRHWLRTTPERYTGLLPEGIPILEEAVAMAQSEQTLLPESLSALANSNSPEYKCRILGEAWEPDFVLLRPEEEGTFRVVGGCVCFPSAWSLAEKIGHPMEFVHGPVPGLNAALGQQINAFMGKMKPGLGWQRLNWSLSRSAELNQHPARNLPQLDSDILPEEIYLRLENQVLVKLPVTQGVLFGIRIINCPLAEVKRDPVIAQGLARGLTTMDESMAAYKRLLTVRETAAQFLES